MAPAKAAPLRMTEFAPALWIFDESQHIDIKSESAIGPDISVGYVHRFTDTIGLDVRYRAIVYFPISGSRSFDDPRVNHGINAGLTFNF